MVKACSLIAAYNEAAHVAEVIRGAARWTSHVVVVDDGSGDGTADRAREAGATVLRHEANLGKGRAIRTGLAYVLAQPFTHVLLIDGDLQHDPDEIPALLGRADGSDLVVGERAFAKDTMPRARFYSNVIGSWILSRFIGAEVMDSQSGFRLVRCETLRHIDLTATGYEIETEMLIKLTRAGATLGRVPIRRLHYDGARSKIRPFRDTFRTCMLALKYRYLSD